jgi:hypothetical protein
MPSLISRKPLPLPRLRSCPSDPVIAAGATPVGAHAFGLRRWT